MTKEEIADIYAGRYVDGMWSYTQALYEGVKKLMGFQKKNLMLRSLHGE